MKNTYEAMRLKTGSGDALYYNHYKNLKSFMWKHSGGMNRVDAFRFPEADLAKQPFRVARNIKYFKSSATKVLMKESSQEEAKDWELKSYKKEEEKIHSSIWRN
ncbi:hypothetical protein LXL04_000779 [Taraxacum kok-saghyz]